MLMKKIIYLLMIVALGLVVGCGEKKTTSITITYVGYVSENIDTSYASSSLKCERLLEEYFSRRPVT
jgi:major membrane immunogen (membrane-anchored lipoprotein)